jgi:putative ABC transport system substrate-binding protein
MKRREFFGLVGGAAAVWPMVARAQQSGKVWRVGFLRPGFDTGDFDSWQHKMSELGYVEGKNLIVDRRAAEGDYSRLPQLAEELVALRPDVILANATPAIAAAQLATITIPIVMAPATDPVGSGFVKSLARPGGNITGMANMSGDYTPKTVDLLRELLPDSKRVAVLMSANTTHPMQYRAAEAAATALGINLVPATAKTASDLDSTFAGIVAAKCDALIVLADAARPQIVPLAAAARLPAIYQTGGHMAWGGLISYGPNYDALNAQTAVYIDKIFKGVLPAELPVEQPITFLLKVNLKTAKELGLKVPVSIISRADEVIE